MEVLVFCQYVIVGVHGVLQIGRRALHAILALLEHIGIVGDGQALARALLDDENGHSETTDCLDLGEDLQAWLDHRVVKAYRTGAVAELKSWVARNKAVASLAVVVALLPAIGVTLFIAQQRRANARLRLHAYASDMNLAENALRVNNVGRALRLLDHHRPQPGEPDLRGWEWRYMWQRCRSDALYTLTRHSDVVRSLSFSRDGRLLAIGAADGLIELWDIGSRQLITTLQTNGQFATVAFAPERGSTRMTAASLAWS